MRCRTSSKVDPLKSIPRFSYFVMQLVFSPRTYT